MFFLVRVQGQHCGKQGGAQWSWRRMCHHCFPAALAVWCRTSNNTAVVCPASTPHHGTGPTCSANLQPMHILAPLQQRQQSKRAKHCSLSVEAVAHDQSLALLKGAGYSPIKVW